MGSQHTVFASGRLERLSTWPEMAHLPRFLSHQADGGGVMDDPLITVAGLHALAYCERLFYLEEVERLRVADAAVYAGRRLHEELNAEDEQGAWHHLELESQDLELMGSVDFVRRRDGQLIPYEHKRGRSAGRKGAREAWDTDRLQVAAYAMLVEESLGQPVVEGRVRYHADNVTVRVAIDADLREAVRGAVARARVIRSRIDRPPVAENERLCVRCSLAPVCLPEESRLESDPTFRPLRLLPPHHDRQVLHVSAQGARLLRSGDQLVIQAPGVSDTRVPIREVGQVVVHGLAQMTTQAIRLCAAHDVGVHWVTFGGGLVGSLAYGSESAQRHLRQFRALSDEDTRLRLARRLVVAKLENQLRFLLRSTRGQTRDEEVESQLNRLRVALRGAAHASAPNELLGHEGNGTKAYFALLPSLVVSGLDARFTLSGRNRRPPRDRVNALLSFGYGMLYREVLQAIIAVGLHPGVGFYHQPRSAAHPLALDIMELFRGPLVDMSVLAALNRRTFDADADFAETPGRVLLSETGRRKAIEIIERRKTDEWRHNVIGYSLSYARLIELEARLLEKEWTEHGGLFARMRLR